MSKRMNLDWSTDEPPHDGNLRLMWFRSGIIATGRWRLGDFGEPQKDVASWRCECCGRFADPVAWAVYPGQFAVGEDD